MAFPFSSWFKGKQAPDEAEPAPEQAPAPRANPAQPAANANMRNSQKISTSSMRAANPVSGPRQTQPVKQAAIRSVVPNSGQPPVNLRESPAPPRPAAPGIRPAGGGTPLAPAKVSPVMPTARTISFGAGGGSPSPSTPVFPPNRPEAEPAAPAPTGPDFVVELSVGDFVDRVPPGLLKAGPYPREQAVKFLSSEFYSDLSKGRASVPASVIYSKCPAIFARAISETEDAEVPLPLQKIVSQMSAALQTRPDQILEETGAEIETPFLQVAKEDNARLPKATGTTVGVLPGSEPRPIAAGELPASVSRSGMRRSGQISPIPSIKPMGDSTPTLAPPTVASSSPINPGKRPPSTVRASVAGGKIRLSGPAVPARNMVPLAQQPVANPPPAPGRETPRPTAGSPSHQVAKKTARIQIPPISLRPPGATGPRPPVAFNPPAPQSASPGPAPAIPSLRSSPPQETKMPNFRPAPPTSASTRSIPATFGATPQPPLPPPAFPATPPAPAMLVPPPAQAPVNDRKISLGLAAILRGVPSSSLLVTPSSIADEERITLPFAPIESQLSQGRVSVPRSVFIEALPEARRRIFAGDDGLEEIPIPLQEVFQNLPANALAIRSDQLVEETTQIYATPFSQKAAEDAERLGFVEPVKPAASVAEAVVATPVDEMENPAVPPVDLVSAEEEPSSPVMSHEAAMPAMLVEEPEAIEDPGTSLLVDTPDELSAPSAEALPPLEAAFTSPTDHPDTALEPSAEIAPEEIPVPDVSSPSIVNLHEEAIAEDPVDLKLPLLEPISAHPSHLELPAPPTELLLLDEQMEMGATTHDSSSEHPVAVMETDADATTEPLATVPPELPSQEPDFVSTLPAPLGFEAPADSPAFDADEASAFTVPSEPPPAEEAIHTSKVAAPALADSPLQTLFMSEDDMDAKTIVRHICQLPGIEGCAIMFADGLPLAGNFPEAYEKAGFSAMAPSFFSRAMTFTEEVRLGRLEAYTLYLDNGLLSFFMCGGIGLSVRHTGRGFLPGVREKLGAVTRELAGIYSSEKPAAPIPAA